MTPALIALAVGFVGGFVFTWRARGRMAEAEARMLCNTLRQAMDDLQDARNDAARWHQRALAESAWGAERRVAVLELTLIEHGLEVPV